MRRIHSGGRKLRLVIIENNSFGKSKRVFGEPLVIVWESWCMFGRPLVSVENTRQEIHEQCI
jgi:hypothetical protein